MAGSTPVHAASGLTVTAVSTTTGSTVMETGALIRMQLQELSALLGRPLPAKRSELIPVLAKESAWQSDVERYSEKSAAYRASCNEAMRRANRDTIVKQSTTCMRGDLLLHISYLRQQQTYLSAIPLLQPSVESGAILALKNLIDAEMTIVNAIDANLYTTTDILAVTKAKLRDQYRLPYWLSQTHIRADRQLTFIGLMLKRLEEIVLENNNTPLIEKTTLNALGCLRTGISAYQSVLGTTDTVTAGKTINEAGKGLSTCKNTVWNVGHLKRRQSTSMSGTGTLQTDAEK